MNRWSVFLLNVWRRLLSQPNYHGIQIMKTTHMPAVANTDVGTPSQRNTAVLSRDPSQVTNSGSCPFHRVSQAFSHSRVDEVARPEQSSQPLFAVICSMRDCWIQRHYKSHTRCTQTLGIASRCFGVRRCRDGSSPPINTSRRCCRILSVFQVKLVFRCFRVSIGL